MLDENKADTIGERHFVKRRLTSSTSLSIECLENHH